MWTLIAFSLDVGIYAALVRSPDGQLDVYGFGEEQPWASDGYPATIPLATYVEAFDMTVVPDQAPRQIAAPTLEAVQEVLDTWPEFDPAAEFTYTAFEQLVAEDNERLEQDDVEGGS